MKLKPTCSMQMYGALGNFGCVKIPRTNFEQNTNMIQIEILKKYRKCHPQHIENTKRHNAMQKEV